MRLYAGAVRDQCAAPKPQGESASPGGHKPPSPRASLRALGVVTPRARRLALGLGDYRPKRSRPSACCASRVSTAEGAPSPKVASSWRAAGEPMRSSTSTARTACSSSLVRLPRSTLSSRPSIRRRISSLTFPFFAFFNAVSATTPIRASARNAPSRLSKLSLSRSATHWAICSCSTAATLAGRSCCLRKPTVSAGDAMRRSIAPNAARASAWVSLDHSAATSLTASGFALGIMATSHRITVVSAPPEARVRPSGAKASELMPPRWAVNSARSLPPASSNNSIRPALAGIGSPIGPMPCTPP